MITHTHLIEGYHLRLAGNTAKLITPCGRSIRLRGEEYESTLAILNDVDEGLCGESDLAEHCRAIAFDAGIAA
jgi:hypothetical protein